MPVNVEVHKMAVVDVQGCWNVLDGTVKIMLCARSPPGFEGHGGADRRGRAAPRLMGLHDFRFTRKINRLSIVRGFYCRLKTASYAAWVLSMTRSNSSRLIFRKAVMTPG